MNITFKEVQSWKDFPRFSCGPWTNSSIKAILKKYDTIQDLLQSNLPNDFKFHFALRPQILKENFKDALLEIIKPVLPIWEDYKDCCEYRIRISVNEAMNIIKNETMDISLVTLENIQIGVNIFKTDIDNGNSCYAGYYCIKAIYSYLSAIRSLNDKDYKWAAKYAITLSNCVYMSQNNGQDDDLRQFEIICKYCK